VLAPIRDLGHADHPNSLGNGFTLTPGHRPDVSFGPRRSLRVCDAFSAWIRSSSSPKDILQGGPVHWGWISQFKSGLRSQIKARPDGRAFSVLLLKRIQPLLRRADVAIFCRQAA
jgi:transposase InsO family protein